MSKTIKFQPVALGTWIMWSAFIIVLLVAPLCFKSNLALTILTQIGTVMIALMSYNMLLGQSGMLSFGHAVYAGLGAFVAIHMMNAVTAGHMWCPTSMIPLVGGLGGAFFGALFGYVTTKKSGTTFAMITLGIGELVASSSFMLPEFFGGEAGITTNRVIGKAVMGITYGPQIQVYYLVVIWLIICAVGMFAFTRTPLGRMANAVRDNPERVEFIGYDTHRVRYLVVILSAFFAGISGGLSAINFEIVNSENVGAIRSGTYLLFTFIGGVGSFIGPMIGAVVLVFSNVVLSEMTRAWLLYLGIFFLLMVIYVPGGIASLLLLNLRVARYGLFKRLLKPYAVAAVCVAPLLIGFTSMIEMIYHLQLDSGNGTQMTVYGVAVDVSSPGWWALALGITVVGGVALNYGGRYFASVWSGVQSEIEARMLQGAA